MFANLKKKLEEGSAVSPVGAERKTAIANSAAKAQNTCLVHGEGSVFFVVLFSCFKFDMFLYVQSYL